MFLPDPPRRKRVRDTQPITKTTTISQNGFSIVENVTRLCGSGFSLLISLQHDFCRKRKTRADFPRHLPFCLLPHVASWLFGVLRWDHEIWRLASHGGYSGSCGHLNTPKIFYRTQYRQTYIFWFSLFNWTQQLVKVRGWSKKSKSWKFPERASHPPNSHWPKVG